MFKEFRDFAIQGNMIDLAIGVIIGAAFGAIVSSIVDDIMMPLFGFIIGGVDFSNLFIVLNNPTGAAVPSLTAAKEAGVATLNIGVFINSMVKFAIIAFVLFLVVKGINSMKKTVATETTVAPTEDMKTMAMAAPKAPSVSAKKKPAAKAAVAPKPASKKAPAKKAKKAPAKKAKKAPAKKAGAKKAPAKKAPAKKAKKAAKRPAKKAAKK